MGMGFVFLKKLIFSGTMLKSFISNISFKVVNILLHNTIPLLALFCIISFVYKISLQATLNDSIVFLNILLNISCQYAFLLLQLICNRFAKY
jgi:hypothetical protein